MTSGVRGVGVDTVDLGAFAASLAEPGTRMARAFSATERRQCRERAEARGASATPAVPDDRLSRHLAGRWAVKEAVVKAWSAALYGSPPPIPPDLLRWAEIETVCDAWGRPSVRLGGEVARQVAATVGPDARWHVSLSHDGGSAVAFVVLETPAGGRPEEISLPGLPSPRATDTR